MKPKGQKKRAKAAAASLVGKDEMNLTEFPHASLSHTVPEDCNQLIFEDEIFDQSSKELIQRKLTITGDAELGLPNSIDDDVLMVLMLITKQRDPAFKSRTVPYSRIEVIELLGWPINGQSVTRLEESLTRWHGVKFDWERAWWDKKTGTWRNEKFHVLDNLSDFDLEPVRRSKLNLDQASLPFCSFTWNEVLFNSFKAGYLKSINLSFYFQLSSAISKRAFRFLDKHFYRDSELSMDSRTFACNKIGLSKAYSPTKMKEKLQPALDELEGFGFLEPLSRDKRYEKVSHGVWKIVFTRGSDFTPIVQADESPASPNSLPLLDSATLSHPLAAKLAERGVTDIIAAELVQQHSAEKIQAKTEEFDWLVSRRDKRAAKNPAGFLVKSITTGKDGYKTPPGFVSQAERDRQAEAARQAGQEQADARSRRRQEEAADEQRRQEENAWWAKLTAEQQAEHDAHALAAASPDFRQTYATMKRQGSGEGFLSMIRRQYIRSQLETEPA